MDTRQQHNKVVSTDEWYTPRWIIDELGPFDLDPCAPSADARPFEIAPTSYTKDDDGLTRDWHGIVWMNPPYSRQPLRLFCEKMAAHGNGIALLVNRQDNLLWQEVIFPTAASMIFMRHRVKFIQPDGRSSSPFFGSCLVAWGRECDRRLRQSGIEGKYVVLNLQKEQIMKLRVIEVKESVPKEDCYCSPPLRMDITHYVPQYYDDRIGWLKCYLKGADTSRPTYYYHLEHAIAICKEYAKENSPTVVWCEDTETDKK